MDSEIVTNLINLMELNGINKLVNFYSKCNVNVKTQNVEMNLNKTQFSTLADSTKGEIMSVFSYGHLRLCNPLYMFANGNIETFTSKGDVILSGNASYMFTMVTSFNSDLSRWNVDNVTDMSFMFSNSMFFKSDLSRWNVSEVTDMKHMFNHVLYFNSDLSRWDVSRVTDMSYMFNDAQHFNSDLSRWDVSRVTDMSYMFNGARYFNSDLSRWDVSRVMHMASVFRNSNIVQIEWDTPNIGKRNYSRQACKNINEYLFGIQSKLT